MNNIRKLSLILAILITLSFCLPISAFAEETATTVSDNPGIISGNVVVAYSMDDNQFLYTYRLDERVAPTVATKLMTCMVVADILNERGHTADKVQVPVTAAAIANSGDIADVRVPMMGFKAGDNYTAKDLLSATLVACANDAAAALAVHFGETYLGGDITAFVARMNKKAEELGLTNTKFENPTGLDSPNQYSTPREIALLATAFYKYNDLVDLANAESFTFNGTTTVRSKNFLKNAYYVKGYTNKNAIGLIAGQLNREGNYCLITASQKDGRTYIFVIMCASGMIVERDEENDATYYSFGLGNAYDDMNKLINWTRDSFELLSIATTDTIIGELRVELGNSTDHVMVVPSEDIERLVINASNGKLESKLTYDDSIIYQTQFNGAMHDTIRAPVTHGQRVGSITYTYNGVEIATVDAIVKESIDSDGVRTVLSDIENFLFGDVMKTVINVIVAIIILYFSVSIVMWIVRIVNKTNAKKKSKAKNTYVVKTNKTRDTKTNSKDNNASTREMR